MNGQTEERLRRRLRLEAEYARVSPDAWLRVRGRIERRPWPRRIAVVAAAAAVIAAAVVVPQLVIDRRTVTDVASSPAPSGDTEADAALRCFFEARVYRDFELARPCLTERFAATFEEPLEFIGVSSPNIVRFTIMRDLERTDDRLRVLARAYEGTSTGVMSYSDDTVTVVRAGSGWGVDGWEQGPEVQIREPTTIDIYLLRPDPQACSRSVEPSAENPGTLVPIEVAVVAGDDLPLRAMQELLMGLRSEDVRADPLFGVAARVRSVIIADGVANVVVNQGALVNPGSCPTSLLREAIDATLRQFSDVREVRVSVE